MLFIFKTETCKDVAKDPETGAENPSITTKEQINSDPQKSAGIMNSITPSPYEVKF